MSRDVVWSGPARRDLQRLHPDTARRVVDAVVRFAATNQGDVRTLRGVERQWRLRVGDWRVIFTANDPAAQVEVIRVLPRDRAHR